ncbi:MAG TPA: response regulator [Terriglobales bacterium]|nr:response regulator [Terriglobales bacterium]
MDRTATVLIIDDEKEQLMLRKMLLETAGHRVLTAHSGKEGLRVFRSETVDAVIIDYWMGDLKGTAVASEMKRLHPSIPVIIFSAFRPLPDEALGKADVWLVKAEIEPTELLQIIDQLLSSGSNRSLPSTPPA